MGSSTRIIRAVLLTAAAAVLAAAAHQLRETYQEADLAVQNIHDQLDALDPATPGRPRRLVYGASVGCPSLLSL
jgi:hypothetical protein